MYEKSFVNFNDNNFLTLDRTVLNILLMDRTTHKNIVWATDDYIHLGQQYNRQYEITIPQITGINAAVIQQRITKKKINQSIRTKVKAEVFTPSWLCNEQNNLIDEQWFGRKDVFNIQSGKSWIAVNSPIAFSSDETRNWQAYIIARRLEIACGEAPYLTSRYDTVSGEAIELTMRIGLLDRKLRVVNENTFSEKSWITWAIKAVQSIYGFEYQGDNLLIARENILFSFIDNMVYKLKRYPTLDELKKIANIISWNIWQMDGLTFSVPYRKGEDDPHIALEVTSFDEDLQKEKLNTQHLCLITDWEANVSMTYKSLMQHDKNK